MTPIRPTPPGFPDAAALLRYVSGQPPLAEAESIRAWLATDPARQASIDELRAAWTPPPAAAPAWDREGVWARLSVELPGDAASHAASDSPATPVTEVSTPTAPRRAGTRRFAAHRALAPRRWASAVAKAAAVVLVVGGGAALAVRPWDREVVAMRDVVTAHGERRVVKLLDGSTVTLDAASRLRVAADLGAPARRILFWRQRSPRRLELVGRAFFDVKHDDARPFIVRTSTATTQDVGTSFVITAYPDARGSTQVAVVEGSVALWDREAGDTAAARARDVDDRRAPPLMLLARGDVGTLDAHGTATRRRGVALESHLSWTRGVLAFDRAPLRDVAAELGRWYDLDIRLADSSLGDRPLTAEIRTETASEALRRIGLVLDVQVVRRGRTVVLSSPSSSSRRAVAR